MHLCRKLICIRLTGSNRLISRLGGFKRKLSKSVDTIIVFVVDYAFKIYNKILVYSNTLTFDAFSQRPLSSEGGRYIKKLPISSIDHIRAPIFYNDSDDFKLAHVQTWKTLTSQGICQMYISSWDWKFRGNWGSQHSLSYVWVSCHPQK